MRQAAGEKKLFKEQPFVLGIDETELYPEGTDGELVLVQGIIDVYFEEADGLVVLDYKTDKVFSSEELVERYAAFYADAPFVQVLSAGVLPRTASVAGTNHAHVGVGVVGAARAIVAVGAIDNLGKGAAGQAVQCANVVFGLPPTRGLQAVAVPV